MEYMDFSRAWFAMLNGFKVKLPSWGGYWYWNGGTIIIHCKDGHELDILDCEDVAFTMSNIASKDWVIMYDEDNENED